MWGSQTTQVQEVCSTNVVIYHQAAGTTAQLMKHC